MRRDHQLNHEEVKKKFSDTLTSKPLPMILLSYHLGDSKNLGAIFRLADAAGIKEVIVIGTSPERWDKVQRVARNADKHLKVRFMEWEDACQELKPDFELLALEITSESISYEEYVPQKPVALIIGNERNGISDEVLQKVDAVIHIPMYGQGSSMNVAVATGIAVFGLLPKLRRL